MCVVVMLADYLIDTSVLSRLLDDSHKDHHATLLWEQALPRESRRLVSVIAVAELRFGLNLAKASNRAPVMPALEEIIRKVNQKEQLDVTHATSYEYAKLKSDIVECYMPKRLKNRSNAGWGNPEAWINEFTGQSLRTQENDLWQYAQAIERDLVFATCDSGSLDIAKASGGRLKLVYIS